MADADVKTDEVADDVVENEGEEDAAEGDQKAGGDISKVMQNPLVLAALQDRLGSMIGQNSGYVQTLPNVVKRRIKALKKLQFEAVKVEAKFYEEVHMLECKYAAQYAPLYDRRKEIVTGGVEPTDSDCDWSSDEEKEDELAEDLKAKVKIEDEFTKDDAKEETGAKNGDAGDATKKAAKEEENPSGIPNFWLTIFKNVDMLSELMQDHDEPILSCLQDIKVNFTESDPMGFTLEFHFLPNDYFTNSVLTKTYILRPEPLEDDPFSYEGPEIKKCKGCTIDWKKGKNITVKTVKKKQKHKGRGTTRTVTKTVANDSFFNFFSPPAAPEDEDAEMDEETETQLATDFEIGHFLRERLVPRAVLFFTGEAMEDEYDEENEEDEDGEEADYDEENDPDFEPPAAGGKQADCKQQ